jgi:ABC-type glycerol-3-phosphate transport system substrate-binding protein
VTSARLVGRRLLVLLVATAVTVGCGACSSEDEPSSGDRNGKVEGTLTMWYSPSESTLGPWWRKFAADFHAKHPDARVEITPYST